MIRVAARSFGSWKANRERAASSGFALQADPAALQVRQFLHKEKTQPQALFPGGFLGPDPLELFEHDRLFLGRDAVAGIGDLNRHMAGRGEPGRDFEADVHPDIRTFRRVLHRVVQQVGEHGH